MIIRNVNFAFGITYLKKYLKNVFMIFNNYY